MTVLRLTRYRVRRTCAGGWQVSTPGAQPWVCRTWREAMNSIDRCHQLHVRAAMPSLGAAVWQAMTREDER